MRLMQTTPDGSSGGTITDWSVPSAATGTSFSSTPMTDLGTNFGGTSFMPTSDGTYNPAWTPPQTPAQTGTTGYNPQGSGDSSWLSGVNSFLTSPLGQLTGAAVPAAYGITQAASAQRNANALTNAISATARPGLNLSNATYGQLTGGPQVGGPMGQYIQGATGAANTLATTAGTYATGNLTPAQQLQVSQNQAAQNAVVGQQLGRPGGMGLDSSAAAAMRTQNANNAAMLTQAIEQNNIAIATAALQGATQTYNQLLSSALNQAQLASEATANAVKQQLQANTQVAAQIQGLMQAIATGMTRASQPQQPGGAGAATGGGAVASPGQTIGSNIMGAAKQVAGWFGGGNSSGTTPAIQAQSAQDWANYNAAGAIGAGIGTTQTQTSADLQSQFSEMPNFNIDTGATSYGAPDTSQASGT